MLYPAELGARDWVGLPAGQKRLAWTAGQRAARAARQDHLEEEGIVKRGSGPAPVARLAKPVEKVRGMS